MLQPISDMCGQAVKNGINLIQYAPIDWLDPVKWDYHPMANISKLFDDANIFNSGKGWLSMPGIIRRKSLSESSERNTQGDYVNVDLPIFIPFYNENIRTELSKMKNLDFILKVKFGKETYLIGDYIYPLAIKYSFGSGDNLGQNTKGVNLTFSGSMPNMAREMLT